MKAINTRKIGIVFVTMFVIGISTASAQATFTSVKSYSPVEFKYLSKVNNQPLFQLNMNNNEADEYYVKVKDGTGSILYSEKVKGKKILRKYLLDINEEDLNSSEFKLSFEVIKTSTHEKMVYKVTRDSHVVEDIQVAQL